MPDPEANVPSTEYILGLLSQIAGVSLNVNPGYIVTTEDKLHIHLTKTIRNLARPLAWTTPFGIFISLFLAVLNSNFKDTILAASVWKTIFVIGVIGAGIWLVVEIVRCTKAESVEQMIERIKKEPR